MMTTLNPMCGYHSVLSSVGRSGKLLLALAGTVILGSESRGTHDRILLRNEPGSVCLVYLNRL
jgi:hypothetical protein